MPKTGKKQVCAICGHSKPDNLFRDGFNSELLLHVDCQSSAKGQAWKQARIRNEPGYERWCRLMGGETRCPNCGLLALYCRAVAEAAIRCGKKITVIPAGKRWPEDGGLRFAVEDMVGAGAILSYLTGRLSPEAQMAVEAYQWARGNLPEVFAQCGSGKELRERGFEDDVFLAAQVNVENCAPRLQEGAYVKAERGTAT